MINIAVVEDNVEDRQRLEEYIKSVSEQEDVRFSLSFYENALSFLEGYKSNFDVVFMDIDLPDMNGMKAAQKLREMDDSVILVFVTNIMQFAVNGYEVNALDFIVKPVAYNHFALKFRRVLERLNRNDDKFIWINGKQGSRRIAISSLKYVEIAKHVLVYHTVSGTFTASGTLRAVEAQLDGDFFALCNQCYLVNLRFVTQVDGYSVIVDGEELQISRPKKREFVRALNAFLNGR